MPWQKFNQLEDEFLAVSKKMHGATALQEKETLLNRLQEILKQSKAVLEQFHQKRHQR